MMDIGRSSVAKRTRAQTKDNYNKMLDENYWKKQREKFHDTQLLNAEKKWEKLDLHKVKERRGEMFRISDRSSDEKESGEEVNWKKCDKRINETIKKCKTGCFDDEKGSTTDVKSLREAEKGEEVSKRKLIKRRRGAVKRGKRGCDDVEESGSDIEIPREEEKGVEVNWKKFNKKMRGKSGCLDDDKGSASDVKSLREEEKGEVVSTKKSNKRRRDAVTRRKNGCDDGEESGDDVEILREEVKGEGVNSNKMNKRRGTVKKGKRGCYDDEGSGSDVQILREEKMGEAINPEGLSKRGRENVKESKKDYEDDKGSGSDFQNPREEQKGEEVNPKGLNKRGRGNVKEGKKGCDNHEGSGSDFRNLREDEKGEEVNPKKLNNRGRETAKGFQNDCDDDDEGSGSGSGSGSDIVILSEEHVPPSLRYRYVKGRKRYPFRGKRSRSDGNRTNERMKSGVPGKGHSGDGAQEKGKNVMIGNLDSLDSESSSSEEDNNDDSDDSDYNKEESESSEMQTNNLGACSENDLEGGEKKDEDMVSQPERSFFQEREEYYEDEGIVGKTIVNNKREDSLEGDVVSEEKVGDTENSLRKRNVHGLNRRGDEVVNRRLLRLRPRLRLIPDSRKVKLRLGTSRNSPILLSESEDSDSSDANSGCDDHVPEHITEGSRKVGKPYKRRASVSQDVDYMNILLNSMLKEADQLKESPSPPEEKAPAQNKLPLKFRFEDENPTPPEKEDWQKEIDNLFAEMEMCLVLPDTDSTKPSTAGTDDVTATANTPAERCLLGEHKLILEEPTGIICKCCQIVYMEMKYIFPALKPESPGRRDWIKFQRGECSVVDELYFGDSACGNYYASIHAEGSVLDLIPADIRMSMYPHQLDGFAFLWKNIAGETCIEKLKTQSSDDGRGCIISHAPGTGKTCLAIVFILSFLKMYPTCRPVIIAPTSMLLTWEDEFQKWGFRIPFHNLNSKDMSGKEIETDAEFLQKVGRRMTKLYSWMNQRSILGISYKLFGQLASGRKGQGSDERISKIFLERPGLMVLDEGHTPRNHQSRVWKVLTKVKTRRKIILSGTPFQNNFDELYNTLCLVNPKLSDPIASESCRRWRWKNNVDKERWVSLTNGIDGKSDNAIEELKAMIDPFVHVHKGTILEERLPGLKDTLVILRPTDQQKDVLQLIPDDCKGFERVHLVSLISVHPSLAATNEQFSIYKDRLGVLGCNPHAGVKTKFAIELIRLSATLHEKVLVFSEFIHPLKFIMKQLADQLKWREGREVLYMDGQRDEKDRQLSISSLNDPSSEVKVLLASTKACSEGINLVGASRVILLDVVWNPSVERQAISRAYRLGQEKLVYVYHLIISGTLEVEKYVRQANKDRLSELVFSCRDSQANKSKISSIVKEDKILEAMLDNKSLNDIFENIVHQPKESNVFADFNYVEHKH
ncbi:hypothetical protein ACH5RR_038889 [Cinchona calisaya]|uniref:Uncharacterized protein n=1 Tax=Cinchona calisaya TaxID=153742 RepID=A0ABD2XZ46_9GENT